MLFVWFGHFSFRVFAPRLFPPRPSFLELRPMVPARFGRTGQLGLPSCLFGHTSSFGWGGWCFPSCRCCSFVAYFCRGVALSLLRCLLLCLLLARAASLLLGWVLPAARVSRVGCRVFGSCGFSCFGFVLVWCFLVSVMSVFMSISTTAFQSPV